VWIASLADDVTLEGSAMNGDGRRGHGRSAQVPVLGDGLVQAEPVEAPRTTEAVVGGVVGELSAPETLLLGLPDGHGRLRVAGRTTALSLPARRELGGLLVPPQGTPLWPERTPSSRFGQLGAQTLAIPQYARGETAVAAPATGSDGPRHG
jgi:hypothetical protein